MAKNLLDGLSAAQKKEIKAAIKKARAEFVKENDNQYDETLENLYKVKNSIQDIINSAKKDGSIPKGTTIDKLNQLPNKKPSNSSQLYKKIFSRTTKVSTPKQQEEKAPKKKAAPKKKVK